MDPTTSTNLSPIDKESIEDPRSLFRTDTGCPREIARLEERETERERERERERWMERERGGERARGIKVYPCVRVIGAVFAIIGFLLHAYVQSWESRRQRERDCSQKERARERTCARGTARE